MTGVLFFYTYERGEPNCADPSIYSLLIQNIELQSSSDKVQFMTTFLLFSLESLFAFTNIAPIFALLMARGALMAHFRNVLVEGSRRMEHGRHVLHTA